MPYSSTLPFELNEDLWFNDGDILVCARRSDSGALCLYKLYRDMLAVHSTSLLKTLDKSLARRPVHVGHTSYAYLSGHHALDLERFFIATHYPIYFLLWKQNMRSFRHALPVFRIALKYQATDVIDALASQLEQDWPTTISEWDASQCEVGSSFEPFGDMGPEDQSSTRVAFMEFASAVQVAHIANLPNILPTACYQLSRLGDLDYWWQDLVFQSGVSEDRRWEKNGLKHHPGPSQTLLSEDDLRHIKTGKANLSRHLLSFKKGLLTELVLHPSCAVAWNIGIPVQSDDVLTDLLELCNAETIDVCLECRLQINERGREERERVWESLPVFFGGSVRMEASA